MLETQTNVEDQTEDSLPGSIAAEMRDWASRTLFMASSISLLEASVFSPGLRFSPAAKGFNLQQSSSVQTLELYKFFLRRRSFQSQAAYFGSMDCMSFRKSAERA